MDKAQPIDEQWKLTPTKMPETPSSLRGVALAEWHRIGPYLTALDRVSEIDRQALFVYCTQWARFYKIMEDDLMPANVLLYDRGPTSLVQHPLLAPLLRSAEATIKIAGEFGLTARTRDLESGHGNRKASALKRLMGNQRKVAEHKLEDNVIPLMPDWTDDDMRPPECMNEKALAEYYELGEKLRHIDLFTPLDVVPLTIGCCLFELYDRSIGQMGSLYTSVWDKDGDEIAVREHPLHKVSTEVHKILQYIWKDYGQTPRFRKVFNGEQKQETREVPLVFKGKLG